MKHIEEIIEDPTVIFIFKEPEILRPPIIKIDDGTFGYTKDKMLLKNINLKIDMESRITIVGGNGVGKTTLLKILTGDLALTDGFIYRHNRLRISFFT
jgi:ATP-binding cassette subfamily F protein 3